MLTDRLELTDAQLDSALGRTSPVVKLGVAVVWLVGLAFTLAWAPPLVLAGAAIVAGVGLGAVRPAALARSIAPLWVAALGIGLFNALYSTSNGDPAAASLVDLGPFRITVLAATNGLALALRVIAIASVGAVFTLTTDPTRLADALVRQAHVSPRFAYGALAAYQAIPRFAEDLTTLRQARRIRGLRGIVASAPAGDAARPGDPPRRPDGAGHGRAGVRGRADDPLPRPPLVVAGRGGRARGRDRAGREPWRLRADADRRSRPDEFVPQCRAARRRPTASAMIRR